MLQIKMRKSKNKDVEMLTFTAYELVPVAPWATVLLDPSGHIYSIDPAAVQVQMTAGPLMS